MIQTDSGDINQIRALISLPLDSWCLCWWLPCEAASVKPELVAM
jgi:hypothetical protein